MKTATRRRDRRLRRRAGPIHTDSGFPAESAAFGGRRAVANVTALSIWREAGGDEAGIAWGRRAARLFEPYSKSGGGYLNYPEVDQTAARVAAAFDPERFAKLRNIKRTWDPDNRFRHTANILPA